MPTELMLGEDPECLDNEILMARYQQFIASSTGHACAGDFEGRDVWARAADRFAAVARRRGLQPEELPRNGCTTAGSSRS